MSIQWPHWNTQCWCTLDAVVMPVWTRLNIVYSDKRCFCPICVFIFPVAFFWFLVPPDKPGGPLLRGTPACPSPSSAPGGATTAGVENLASWGVMWSSCLSPGMQIYDPRGDADSYTEWLIYSKHSPGRGLRVCIYSMRTWLHTLTTFTNGYVKQGFATPFRQA